jgi:hypothetical protein
MTDTAFNAKIRIVDNNSDRENAPERNLIIDISVEEALKAANWLADKKSGLYGINDCLE